MKKLITTHEGGMPLTLDRIRWMDEGINEALHAICRSLLPPGATSLILEGCEVVSAGGGDQYNVSAGWLYRDEAGNGRICRVLAHTFSYQGADPFPAVGTTPRWMDSMNFDASGSVTFHDGSNKQVHGVQRATVVVDDDPSNPAVVSVPGRIGTWKPIEGSNLIQYRLTPDTLEIRGEADEGYLGKLPAAINPGIKVLHPVACQHEDQLEEYGLGVLKINQTGEIYLIRKDGIQYDVDYHLNVIIPI